MTLSHLNELDTEAFVAAIGPVYEDSPWIARAAAAGRPYGSIEALRNALAAAVREAGRDAHVALIAAHPDLAGRVAREGRLTRASQSEQMRAGLEALSDDERARFDRLNAAYRARFAMPFVICARAETKASILAAMERRLNNDRESEIAIALREIEEIARLRLLDAVEEA